MDTTKMGQGTLIAGASGAALFVIMFFSWFGVDLGGAGGLAEAAGVDTTANAWQSFDLIDLVLLATVIVAVGGAVIAGSGARLDLPFPISTATAGLGALATILVLYRVLNPPGEGGVDREIGLFLGLIASAGVAYGGYTAMQEEGVQAPAPRE